MKKLFLKLIIATVAAVTFTAPAMAMSFNVTPYVGQTQNIGANTTGAVSVGVQQRLDGSVAIIGANAMYFDGAAVEALFGYDKGPLRAYLSVGTDNNPALPFAPFTSATVEYRHISFKYMQHDYATGGTPIQSLLVGYRLDF